MKCFSLTYYRQTGEYDHQIVPLLHRILNLEKKTLYLLVRNRDGLVNGTHQYPHLTSIDVTWGNIDYIEQFLFETKAYLPRLTELKVSYEELKTVTENFTRDATRHNCAKVKRLINNELVIYLKEVYL